ncbi:MAG TPA: type II toxin-antitoxin system VapB family antitoxin [Acetobacteraceae bacterium]|jgi:hypothetical protein|nr:type II toxin-antitoxin system VapB family antitoxin [Acetobacteraceae bacterium]
MGVQLNIKGDGAYVLAAELAEPTGESLTTAVTAAPQRDEDGRWSGARTPRSRRRDAACPQ